MNGLPFVSLEELKTGLLPKAKYEISSTTLSTALRDQRACILDIGVDVACTLGELMPDGRPLCDRKPAGAELIDRPEREILRFNLSPDSKENSISTQVRFRSLLYNDSAKRSIFLATQLKPFKCSIPREFTGACWLVPDRQCWKWMLLAVPAWVRLHTP